MSGSKRLPCQKEACAIQKCLQGMTLVGFKFFAQVWKQTPDDIQWMNKLTYRHLKNTIPFFNCSIVYFLFL